MVFFKRLDEINLIGEALQRGFVTIHYYLVRISARVVRRLKIVTARSENSSSDKTPSITLGNFC